MPSDRYVLILVYLGVAYWFGGAIWAHCSSRFIPYGLGIAALLTGALVVRPFLYAALLIEMAVIVSVPLLTSPGTPVGRGVLRFLTFQSLGFPFILFTGWLLVGVAASPGESELVIHALTLMAFGFAFLLGVFPFHTWIPMLAEEAHPYSVAFVFFELTLVVSLFGVGFLDRFVWLRSSMQVYLLLQYVGAMMVAIGGIWAAVERHLGRMMGYAVLMEIGYSMLAVSVGLANVDGGSLTIFFALMLPRGLSFGIWSLALIIIAKTVASDQPLDITKQLHFRKVQGMARPLPLAALALLFAHFSLAGLPLLAGFPARLSLLSAVIRQSSIVAAVVVLGIIGFLAGGLRTLAILVMGQSEAPWVSTETIGEKILLACGAIILVLVGLFPQWFTPTLVKMLAIFTHFQQ